MQYADFLKVVKLQIKGYITSQLSSTKMPYGCWCLHFLIHVLNKISFWSRLLCLLLGCYTLWCFEYETFLVGYHPFWYIMIILFNRSTFLRVTGFHTWRKSVVTAVFKIWGTEIIYLRIIHIYSYITEILFIRFVFLISFTDSIVV